MPTYLEVTVGALSGVSVFVLLVGLAVKYALLPWLREHLVVPVQETQRQVTVNRHESNPPTLLDRVDTVSDEVRIAALMFEGHMLHSEQHMRQSDKERADMWRAIRELQRKDRHP